MSEGTHPYSIFLAGGSKVKKYALQSAVNAKEINAAVIPISNAESGINEQPIGESEILAGALNRVQSAYAIDPRGDLYIAIENGIEQIDGAWKDYAIVLANAPGWDAPIWVKSAEVLFPDHAVVMTELKPGGFKDNTVGKTLKELGLVRFHDDPHLDLAGISRREILENALIQLFGLLPTEFQRAVN